MLRVVGFLVAMSLVAPELPAAAQTLPRDAAIYEPELKDEVLEQIKERNRKLHDELNAAVSAIRKHQEAGRKARQDGRKVLRATLPESELPGPPESFQPLFHFEPQAQYMTGTCWAFAATSFMESEAFRISGRKIKLSEMHTVYYEYLDKVARFVEQRGDSLVTEGSQHGAIRRVFAAYGAVPAEAYTGVKSADGWHDHMALSKELSAFLAFVKQEERWEQSFVMAGVREILDRHLGAPPANFAWKGKEYTPRSFLEKVLKLHPEDYVEVMSTMSAPFFRMAEFEVPDNWGHDASYYNVPLDLFYSSLVSAVATGYTVAIGGDVSEPGKNYRQDIAFVPTFDIPGDYIDQSAREYRIENGSTGDDHGIHLVGMSRVGEHTWFLIKDSGRSARHGRFAGYYFFRDDFVKLKMLTWFVHKDAVKDALSAMLPPEPEVGPEKAPEGTEPKEDGKP
ncbi:MAG: peptidase C1 [Deltaproteobacteria bacterium]|nr:peptidase C1 [Deltaproteobacteria bacterium]